MAEQNDIQYHIEIQEEVSGSNMEGEIMVVLDLDGQELPASVAQTIMELAQSGAPIYQDAETVMQSEGVGEIMGQESCGTVSYITSNLDSIDSGIGQVMSDNSLSVQRVDNGQFEGGQVLTYGQDRLLEQPVNHVIDMNEVTQTQESFALVNEQNKSSSVIGQSGQDFIVVVERGGNIQGDASESVQLSHNSNDYDKIEADNDLSHNNESLNLVKESNFEESQINGSNFEESQIDDSYFKESNMDQSNNGEQSLEKSEVSATTFCDPLRGFQCELCDFTSNSEISVGRHVKSVHKVKTPFKCYTCEKTFEKELSLQIHSLSHELRDLKKIKNGFFVCPLCDFECRPVKKLVAHFEEEHRLHQLHSCPLCKFACLNSADLNAHTLTMRHQRNMSRLKVCPVCNLSCMNLEKHMNSAHSDVKPYLCVQCGYRAKVEACMKAHMLTHIDTKNYVCLTCQAAFKSSARLKRHMTLHDPSKKHKCPDCTFSTNIKYDLTRHRQRAHYNKKSSFNCKFCEETFSNVTDLKRHAMSEHRSKDRYYCEYCDFSCEGQPEFRAHMPVHSVYKHRFFCSDCEFSTPWKCHFDRHRTTHSEIKHKPFVCPVCNYSCLEKVNLKKHMVIHSSEKPFSCNQCEYRCKLKGLLTIHQRIAHSDLRPFCCDICQYRTKTSGNLNKHMRIHEQHKPFQCPICVYKCRESNKLQRHIDTKHHTIPPKREVISYIIDANNKPQVVQVYTNQYSKEVKLELTGNGSIF